jgi:hypothetical protein
MSQGARYESGGECRLRRNSQGSNRSQYARTPLQPVRAAELSPGREAWEGGWAAKPPGGGRKMVHPIFRSVPGLPVRGDGNPALAHWARFLRSFGASGRRHSGILPSPRGCPVLRTYTPDFACFADESFRRLHFCRAPDACPWTCPHPLDLAPARPDQSRSRRSPCKALDSCPILVVTRTSRTIRTISTLP